MPCSLTIPRIALSKPASANILLADRHARHGENSFNDEYYDRFYNQAAAILIRQLSDAATDVGSFWFTAWKNAGSPQLPH